MRNLFLAGRLEPSQPRSPVTQSLQFRPTEFGPSTNDCVCLGCAAFRKHLWAQVVPGPRQERLRGTQWLLRPADAASWHVVFRHWCLYRDVKLLEIRMNFKRRGDRWALYRTRWIPRAADVPHGYSVQQYVDSIGADVEVVPDQLLVKLSESEVVAVQQRVCVPAVAARKRREAEESRLAVDPVFRLRKAADLIFEAAALSQHRPVDASLVQHLERALSEVKILGGTKRVEAAGHMHPMKSALLAIRMAAKEVREGGLGAAPSMGARNTPTYALWAQIVEAVDGGGGNSLLAALQQQGYVKRKRS